MIAPDALAELQVLCPGTDVKSEAGQIFIYLPALRFLARGAETARDALLAMQTHSGYPSRLFVAEQVAGFGQNWTVHSVLGRTWHTPSWTNVQPGRPMEMLLQHLKVYA